VRFVLGCVLLALVGCGAPRLLPTTIFHAPVAEGRAPGDDDWARLTDAGAGARSDRVLARATLGDDDWIAWLVGEHTEGTIVHARRTAIGLEAQSIGTHVGPSVRPSIRVLTIGAVHVVVVESSIAADSSSAEPRSCRSRSMDARRICGCEPNIAFHSIEAGCVPPR